MATFNFSLPTIDYASMSNQDYIKKVANNLAVLTEELQYTLNNLEISNMTDSTAEWLKKIGGSSITVTDEMIEIISQTINIVADNIHLEGYTTINGGAWFDLEGNFGAKNGTFNGSIIGGLIQSLNYIVRDTNGVPVLDLEGNQQETGEGTYINLDESYAIFKGITNYAWLGELAAYHSMSTEIDNGRLVFTDLTNNNKKLWFSYEGISTTEDGSDAVGVIDFRSNLFNSEDTNYQGITLVGYGSPVGILVHRGVCVISPAADQAVYDVTNMLSDKFIFDVNKRYAQTGSVIDYNTPFVSEFRDGEGVIAFSKYAWDGTTRHNHVALLFSKDTDNPYLKVTNGTQTALAPIYASNVWGAISAMECTKDTSGRITSIELTFADDTTFTVGVSYDASDNITVIGDTTVSYV